MALFPQTFLDDLKTQTNIVSVIGDIVSLKKAGATWKGLCPFHQERTPSFTVNGDKGFFKCFGCGAGGDVVKFVELHQKASFPEAVRYLAQRAGLAVPEAPGGADERAAAKLREELTRLHEEAALFYQEQLGLPVGARAARELESRGLSSQTIKEFGYGFAPAGGRATLGALFDARKVPVELQIQSGLVLEREGGRRIDRFRNRLMIPIARDSGPIVAFGGRALEDGQLPKYLNSPETPLYTKGRTLYGLHVTKAAIRKHNYCVLVEGYFDLAQAWQAGIQPVVASCGTALTSAQARVLKRFTSKVVLSFDPDAAGQGAATRSSEMLVSEGFQVNVALLPEGSDPDVFIRRQGAKAYRDRLTSSQPYLDFLLDRAATKHDVRRPEGRRTFLNEMLAVAATIPDAADRDQFADRLAHKARVTETVMRDEIRKAAAGKHREAPAIAAPAAARLRPAEQGLLWALVHHPVEGLAALAQLEDEDLTGLGAEAVFRLGISLGDVPPDFVPGLLRERCTGEEWAQIERAAAAGMPPAGPADCVHAIRRLRVERERTAVQEEIDRLERKGGASDDALRALWAKKKELLKRLQ